MKIASLTFLFLFSVHHCPFVSFVLLFFYFCDRVHFVSCMYFEEESLFLVSHD